MFDRCGRIVLNRHDDQMGPFDLQKLGSDRNCRLLVAAQIFSKFPDLGSQPNDISDMGESFTGVTLDAVEAETPPPIDRTHMLGRCKRAEISASFTEPLYRKDARRFTPVNLIRMAAWKAEDGVRQCARGA